VACINATFAKPSFFNEKHGPMLKHVFLSHYLVPLTTFTGKYLCRFQDDQGSISTTFFARVVHTNVFFLVTFCFVLTKNAREKTLVKSTPDGLSKKSPIIT